MKRIRNIHDLEYEKLKLRVKQLELEKQMDRSWKRLSSKLTSTSFNEQKQSTQSDFKTGNTLLSGALNYGASFLSHKLGILAGKKAEATAEQMLGKLAEKINSLGTKKKKFQKS